MDGPRPVERENYREAIGLLDQVFRLDQGLPATILPECPVVLGRKNSSRMVVISEDGRVVSHAAYIVQHHSTPRGEFTVAGVSSVATHPDYRRRGHAKAILEKLHELAAAEGVDIAILGTGSPDFYRPLGYEYAGEEYHFELAPAKFNAPRFNGVIRPFAGDDLDAMRELHREKPYRISRDKAHFFAMLHCPKEKIIIAEREGEVLAYAIDGKGEDMSGWIVDWAGAVDGIIGCIGTALGGRDSPLRIALPEADTPLAGELTDLGFPVDTRPTAMVKVVDLQSFLSKTCTEMTGSFSDGTYTLTSGDVEISTTEAGLVSRILFGPEPLSELAIEAPVDMLAEVPEPFFEKAEAEFPIPLHVPGLDRV